MERFLLEVLLPLGLILIPLAEAGVAKLIASIHAKTPKGKAEAEQQEKERQEQIDKRIARYAEKHEVVTKESIGEELEGVHDTCRQKATVEKMNARIQSLGETVNLLQESMQYSTRQLLCVQFTKYHERGWASIEEKREIEHMYKIYHQLGPNGVLDNKYKAFMELPDEMPDTHKRRASDKRENKEK